MEASQRIIRRYLAFICGSTVHMVVKCSIVVLPVERTSDVGTFMQLYNCINNYSHSEEF